MGGFWSSQHEASLDVCKQVNIVLNIFTVLFPSIVKCILCHRSSSKKIQTVQEALLVYPPSQQVRPSPCKCCSPPEGGRKGVCLRVTAEMEAQLAEYRKRKAKEKQQSEGSSITNIFNRFKRSSDSYESKNVSLGDQMSNVYRGVFPC